MSKKLLIALIATVSVAVVGGGVYYVSEKMNAGCCTPFCQEMGKWRCEQFHGGTWTKGSCDQVEDCQEGCCTPHCTESTKIYCQQSGGTPHKEACSELEECQKGCCLPFCVELTKVECEQRAGTPQREVCETFEECQKGCCIPFEEEMLKIECEQRGGKDWVPGECKGLSAHLDQEGTHYPAEGQTARYVFTLDVHTCEDNINSNWTGTWKFDWTYTHPEGTFHDSTSGGVSFTPDPSGALAFSIADLPVTGNISQDQMSINFEWGELWEPISPSGPVVKGAPGCKEE